MLPYGFSVKGTIRARVQNIKSGEKVNVPRFLYTGEEHLEDAEVGELP